MVDLAMAMPACWPSAAHESSVSEAAALALGLNDPAMVREPVERRPRESFRAEHLGPRLERQVVVTIKLVRS